MKTAGILVLCVFSSILSTVTSLKCRSCVAFGTECGEETEVECKENEEFCSTAVLNSTITNASMSLIIKECSKPENCFDGLFSTTTIEGRFEVIRVTCCKTDACNVGSLLLEDHETLKPNGLQCLGCVALDKDHCEADQLVNCVGEEDQCLTLTSTTQAFGNFTEKSTYQACAIKKSCSYPLGHTEVANGLINFNVTILECKDASPPEPEHQ
ncbi:phospholipase A2 inhibitor NAI-like [Erythrolamprus reginae]|uniref:phospholipase A2 inhibitor NAI-like n=1 Tax=Erythrolamprus reginae TaxID=121349 RepID=UPI00396C71E7